VPHFRKNATYESTDEFSFACRQAKPEGKMFNRSTLLSPGESGTVPTIGRTGGADGPWMKKRRHIKKS
jgi:hypothetical protein